MLKWLAIIVGALIGLVVIIWAVGMMLPQSHVATASLALQQPADSVWGAVREIGAYPEWWSNANSVSRDTDRAGEVWVLEDPRGGQLPIEVVESEPPLRLVTRITEDESLPFGGTWTYEIEPGANGVTLTVTEAGEVYNPIFRFFSRFVFGHYTTIESYLEDLAGHFGAAPEITRH